MLIYQKTQLEDVSLVMFNDFRTKFLSTVCVVFKKTKDSVTLVKVNFMFLNGSIIWSPHLFKAAFLIKLARQTFSSVSPSECRLYLFITFPVCY